MHRCTVRRLQSRYAKTLRREPEQSSASRAAAPTGHPILASQSSPFLRPPRVGCIRGSYWMPPGKSWISPVPSPKAERRPRLETPIQFESGRPWDLLVCPFRFYCKTESPPTFPIAARRHQDEDWQSWDRGESTTDTSGYWVLGRYRIHYRISVNIDVERSVGGLGGGLLAQNEQLARTRLNVPLFQRPIGPLGAEEKRWKVFMTIRSALSFT